MRTGMNVLSCFFHCSYLWCKDRLLKDLWSYLCGMSNVYFKSSIPKEYEAVLHHSKALNVGENDLVVHDFYHRSPGSLVGFWDVYRENKWLKKAVPTTENIFVFSSHTKTEVLKYFPQVRDKISILAPVAEEQHRPTDDDARDVVRYQFTQGDAYFLYRGPVHPAANIIELLKGFSIFKKRIGSNMKLILAGPQGQYSADILTDLESYKYRNDVVLMEHLLPYDESSIISAAYAMVHPCRYERFGIPVVNAMKAGVAVLTAENSSMAEFTGMAGMFFNEKNPQDIGDKLIRIYNDEQMRSEMIGTGLLR
jgi:glycosyltransferase involved in cell wall biosynthesis